MAPLPQLNVRQVAEKIQQRRNGGPDFILLDVREPEELTLANLGETAVSSPLSDLAELGLPALPEAIQQDKEIEIVVMCHHGIRSAQVCAWLRGQGWQNVYNMSGGIAAYALIIDPSIGHY
jgi:rhodanese-related sulfurtransferase